MKPVAVILVALCLSSLFPKYTLSADQADATSLVLAGGTLSDAAAQQLEDALKQTPNDLSIRTELLGYYSARRSRSESENNPRQRHVFWIIQNHPEAEIAGLPYAQFDFVQDREAYEQGAQLWRQQVTDHPTDPAILRNAANFFLLYERPFAEELLKKGATLEPNNPTWPEKLGYLYELGSSRKSEEDRKQAAIKALAAYERAHALYADDLQRSYMLDKMARSAFDANAFDKANTYARQILEAAGRQHRRWNTDKATHHSNLILGRLALKAGDVEKAKQYLVASVNPPVSPQLGSFGPNMTLAKELLEKGQRDVVLEYFQLCAKFWKMGAATLQEWTSIVNQGGIPSFGANLEY